MRRRNHINNFNKQTTKTADTARLPSAPLSLGVTLGPAPELLPEPEEEVLPWPDEPVWVDGLGAIVVVPLMSDKRKAGINDSIYEDKLMLRTLFKAGQGIASLHIWLRLVRGDAHGHEVRKRCLELAVKLHGLGHGEVVELVRQHDRTTLNEVRGMQGR